VFPGTGRVQVTLHLAEGGATDEDRARWSGELVEQFDPDSGDQVLGPRDEEAEAVTVAGVCWTPSWG
jgi:hypothetical protein